jgi:hypothetical protein
MVEWTPDSKTIWNPHTDSYVYLDETDGTITTNSINEPDTDWEVITQLNDLEVQQDDDDLIEDNFIEDVSWMCMNDTIETWTTTDTGAKTSTRIRYQSRPVVVY